MIARVLAVADGGVWLWRQARTWQVPALDGVADPQPGDLVQLHDGTARRLVRGAEGFPHPDGDFQRLAEAGAQRWLAVRARAVLLRAIRNFFDKRGFCEVDTPAVATSPGLELHLDAVEVRLRTGMGGPPTSRWLVTSPEYHCKRLLSAGFEQIYSLGHAFRSGERGQHHNPEFAMLEWYRAGADYRAIVRDCRALVRHCARALRQAPDLRPLWTLPDRNPPLDPDTPWQRWSIRQVIQQFAGFDPGRADDAAVLRRRARQAGLEVADDDGPAEVLVRALVERVEPRLVEHSGVVLERWPACLASLARRFDAQPHLAERFEIYLQGVEIANGFSELTDADEQRLRFEQDLAERRRLGRPIYPIDERFLLALREGLPPSAGVALGVDRLLMALTGLQDIDQVLAFPFERT